MKCRGWPAVQRNQLLKLFRTEVAVLALLVAGIVSGCGRQGKEALPTGRGPKPAYLCYCISCSQCQTFAAHFYSSFQLCTN